MMKIAIPTRENEVDDHFGHCEYYTVLTIGQDNQILSNEIIPSPQGCGCKSNIAGELEKMGGQRDAGGEYGTRSLECPYFPQHKSSKRLFREYPACCNRLSEWENHRFRYRLFIP